MDNEFFRLDLADSGVAHLQFNRPERLNTFAPPFFPAFRDAVRQLGAEGRARALVISSTGKHFSAGMALDVFAGGSSMGRPETNSAPSGGRAQSDLGGDMMPMLNTASARSRMAFQDGLRQLMACIDVLEEARFPVIAAVQGGCIGGALDLAAACDLRVCSADAFFTVQEIHIGMAADLGVLQRLPKIVPPAVAREMAYTGDRLGAERALAVGLVNAVLPDAAATLAHAMTLAASIAGKSPLAVAGSKLAINYAIDHPTADALQQMTLLQSAIFDIDEMAVAITAWKAKAAAAFEPLAPVEPV
jgi:enoyl-CoA hydratase